jgi:hypothetical protein
VRLVCHLRLVCRDEARWPSEACLQSEAALPSEAAAGGLQHCVDILLWIWWKLDPYALLLTPPAAGGEVDFVASFWLEETYASKCY